MEEKHTHFDETNLTESHAEAVAATASAPAGGEESVNPMCVVCNEDHASYQPDSCQCAFSYCKKCAMKCATGGKCKVCKTFFGGLRLSEMGH
jgi:hypothetical protein